MPRGWFGPKRIGWGIGPSSAKGWLVMLIWVIGLVGLVPFAAPALSQYVGLDAATVQIALVIVWTCALGIVIGLTYRNERT